MHEGHANNVFEAKRFLVVFLRRFDAQHSTQVTLHLHGTYMMCQLEVWQGSCHDVHVTECKSLSANALA